MKTTRRDFLKNGTALAAGVAVASSDLGTPKAAAADAALQTLASKTFATPVSERRGDMLYRVLGQTGERVSLIGLGGFHIGKQAKEQESIRIIRTAIDRGVTFMDNCWDYNEGTSEVRMGKALRNGYRDKVFLMSKIDGRSKTAAARQIDESLLRLQTDHLDLVQFHEIIRLEDPDRVFAPGGALEAALAARQAGKVRHIGFTGHKDPLVHLRMLETARHHNFHFDTVQMPVNVMDAHFRSFQRQVLPVLLQQKIGVLAMKTFGDPFILDHLVKSGTATPTQLLHYSMSQPVSVVITGIDNIKVLEQALEAARTFQPMTGAQRMALLARTAIPAANGKYELFKTTSHFDGTAKNPHWLG